MGRSVVDNGEMRILALIFCENVEKKEDRPSLDEVCL